ncbi:hypothetical protein [Candidatus Enterovibrio altilux]|uniref:Beta-ketoacyl synthase C-terminal domain-containing protein n=1 Tax=Candidatus Enterovibrio altilux TaxID=1927128 RepID=A0A291BC08_9GAMM|nr:hypothetical protein [Candidatus Enterovibrio luxaltus]ATF10485.1 hypothetical protein BTN50_2076 [Candidatus Enterovibrio luxaltus]
METKSICLMIDAAADKTMVSSTKSMIGHLSGAVGSAECIIMPLVDETVASPFI